jgi:hypothetical protein
MYGLPYILHGKPYNWRELMSRKLLARLHLSGAAGALAVITAFLAASAAIEPFGDAGELRDLRQGILVALPVLIACLATAALTGRRLAGRSRAVVVRRKQRRMQVVAAAGLLVLIPCAVALDVLAAGTASGGLVAALEVTEFLAGGLNLTLLALNFRDGRAMTRRRRVPVAGPVRVHTGA